MDTLLEPFRAILMNDSLTSVQRQGLKASNIKGDPQTAIDSMRTALVQCGVPNLADIVLQIADENRWSVGVFTQMALTRFQVVMLAEEGWEEMSPNHQLLLNFALINTVQGIIVGLASGRSDMEMYSFISNQWKNDMALLLQNSRKKKDSHHP